MIEMMAEFNGKKPRIHKTAFVAETVEIVGDVEIGRNSSVWNGAVLRGDENYIKIGSNTSVQDNSVVHATANDFPTVVGNNVTIGHNSIVHGCRIGNNCIIGMGSIILDGAEIGDWCIVGAGAVVTEGAKIPGGSIVVGIPGKIIKKVSKEQRERITRNWKAYVELKSRYKK